MTPDEADVVLGRLVAMTSGWTDDAVMEWHRHLSAIPDFNAALMATEAVIGSWQGMGKPTWAFWRECYLARANRDRPALPRPSEGAVMSLSDWGELQRRRAERGDSQAADLHAEYEKVRAKMGELGLG